MLNEMELLAMLRYMVDRSVHDQNKQPNTGRPMGSRRGAQMNEKSVERAGELNAEGEIGSNK